VRVLAQSIPGIMKNEVRVMREKGRKSTSGAILLCGSL